MTAWLHWESWRRLSAVAADGMSSATVLGEEAAEAMRLLVEHMRLYAPDAFPSAALAGVDMLAEGQPSAAPIANLQNVVHLACEQGLEALGATIDAFVSTHQQSRRNLGMAGSLISPGATVMVHSFSSSVLAVLLAVPHSFRVVCTEALPGGEGREMAADLASRGFEVELLSDSEAVSVVAGMDLVLVGADAIGPGRSINKVGTCDIAEAAAEYDVPVYTVASLSKVLPEELFERAASASRGRSGDLLVKPGVGGLAEVVPLSWFRGVITEDGVLAPGDLSKRATEQVVARSLR